MFQVYLLVDYQSYLVYYVGYSKHYLQRFYEHCRRNKKIQDILSSGIELLPYVVEAVPTISLAMEYEERWICHCIQTYQPIANNEANNQELVYRIRNSSLDFINLPSSVEVFYALFFPDYKK